MAWTTDDLLSAVKRRAQLPSANGKLSDQDILDLATEELRTQIIPMITTAAEHYFVREYAAPFTPGQDEYVMPSSLLSGTLVDVSLCKIEGTTAGPYPSLTDFKDIASIPQIPLADLSDARGAASSYAAPFGFCIRGNTIIFIPTPTTSSYSFRFRYIRHTSRLVPVSECQAVTSFVVDSPSAGIVTFTVPTVPSAFTAGGKLDLVQAVPNFSVWADYCYPNNATATTFEVWEYAIEPEFFQRWNGAISDGDGPNTSYWCLQGTTCVPPVPTAFHSLLVAATTAEVLRVVGDFQGAAIEQEECERKKQRLVATIAPRTRSRGNKIISSSHPLRTTIGRRGGFWWY